MLVSMLLDDEDESVVTALFQVQDKVIQIKQRPHEGRVCDKELENAQEQAIAHQNIQQLTPQDPATYTSAFPNVGLIVWQAGLVLADYLLRTSPCGPWPALQVLELGCGVGQLGISLAMSGAQVTMTDLPHIVPLTQDNVDLNSFGMAQPATVLPFLWGSDPAVLGYGPQPPDLVVAADVLYEPQYYPLLLATLQDMCPAPAQGGGAAAAAAAAAAAGGPEGGDPAAAAAAAAHRDPGQVTPMTAAAASAAAAGGSMPPSPSPSDVANNEAAAAAGVTEGGSDLHSSCGGRQQDSQSPTAAVAVAVAAAAATAQVTGGLGSICIGGSTPQEEPSHLHQQQQQQQGLEPRMQQQEQQQQHEGQDAAGVAGSFAPSTPASCAAQASGCPTQTPPAATPSLEAQAATSQQQQQQQRRPMCYVCYRVRKYAEHLFQQQAAAAGFEVEEVPREELHEEYRCGGWQLLRLVRTSHGLPVRAGQ